MRWPVPSLQDETPDRGEKGRMHRVCVRACAGRLPHGGREGNGGQDDISQTQTQQGD